MKHFVLLTVFSLLSCSTLSEKIPKNATKLLKVSKWSSEKDETCNLLGIIELRGINNQLEIDKTAKMLALDKFGVNTTGSPPNKLVHLGTVRKQAGFLFLGSTIIHSYAVYRCFIPRLQ